MKRMLGDKAATGFGQWVEKVCPYYTKYTEEFCFGELHSRGVLSDKEREIAIVACLIGQRNCGTPLKLHLRGMLNVGWSKEQVKELVLLLIAYAGFPDTVGALGVLKRGVRALIVINEG